MHLENQQMPLLVHFRVLYLTLGYTGIHWDTFCTRHLTLAEVKEDGKGLWVLTSQDLDTTISRIHSSSKASKSVSITITKLGQNRQAISKAEQAFICGHWYLHDWIHHKNALTGVHETGYEWQLIGVVNTWLFQTG